MYDDVVKLAFLLELAEIYEETGVQAPGLPKLAADPRLDELIKEARLLAALRAAGKQLSPAQRQLSRYAELGLGETAEKALKASRPTKRLEQWGKTMRQTPVQRVRAAGGKVLPGEAREITEATKAMGGTSLAKRLTGAAAEGAAKHTGHAGVAGKALTHVGLPIGGAAEGIVKQLGREAKSLGVGHRAAAARGAGGARGAVGRGLTRAGEAAQRHAGKVGKGLELGTMAALPLPTGVGTIGQAIGQAVPGLGAAGGYAAHLAEKGLGTLGLKGAGRAAARAAPAVAKKLAPAFVGAA